MNYRRLVVLIVIGIFAAGSSGFCVEHADHDEDHGSHHCLASCHAGCCSAVLQNQPFSVTLDLVSSISIFQTVPLKTAFKSGIKRPPKVSA